MNQIVSIQFLIPLFIINNVITLANDKCPKGCVCIGYDDWNCNEVSADAFTGYEDIGIGSLKRLSVKNSTFDPKLWSFVCNSSGLEILTLMDNQLTELPLNCFGTMKQLISLNASQNSITFLQDGVFDGLESLKFLSLNSNKISEIGINVFTNVSLFRNLEHIDLRYNELTSLDSWPLFLGSFGVTKFIDTAFNEISSFSDYANFTSKSMRISIFLINLSKNKVASAADMLRKWTRGREDLKLIFQLLQNVINWSHFKCDCNDYVFFILKLERYLDNLMQVKGCHGGESILNIDPQLIHCYVEEYCPPKCVCLQRPYNYTLLVDCSRSDLKFLPMKLPSRKPMTYLYTIPLKYDLVFSHNSISKLDENSTFLKHTASLDLSNGDLSFVSPGAWNLMRKFKRISLHNNSLSTLPKEVQSINFSANHWTLHDNPWMCNCENAWMKDWFRMIKPKQRVLCALPQWHTNKDILMVDFCYQPPFDYQILLKVFATILIILVSIFGVTMWIWRKYKYHIFGRYGIRYIFDSDECLNENMSHDIFLSSSHLDSRVAIRFLDKLENEFGFELLYHSRDFSVGGLINDNISCAINRCKRTLCLVSENFLSSYWCVEEFKQAYLNDLMTKKRRLLVVLIEQLDCNRPEFPVELKNYFQTRTYIEMFKLPEDDVWKRLSYCLPKPKRDISDDDVSMLIS